MKKAVIFAIMMFSINSLFAQINLAGESHYFLKIDGYMARIGDGCGNIDGLKDIKIIKQIGEETLWSGRIINQNFPLIEKTYTKQNKIKQVVLKKENRWEVGVWPIILCEGGPVYRYNKVDISDCFYEYNTHPNDGMDWYKIISKPIINIQTPITPLYLSNEEYLTITIHNNVEDRYFKWKYRVGSGESKDIPTVYNYKPTLKIKGKDFLKKEDFGKNIFVWVDLKEVCSYCEKNSNSINFVYQKSLPKLISHTYSKTSCYDSDDGKIVLQFDRALEKGEDITLNVIGKETKKPLPENKKHINITKLQANNTYTINNLPAGNYEIRINGSYNGLKAYSPQSSEPIHIVIEKNPPVNFSFTQKDVFCHNGKDGEIYLTANGGTGNGYEYNLNKNNVWIPFDNNDKHTIKNLALGSYTINVRDSNGCIAKIQKRSGNEIFLENQKDTPVYINQPTESLQITYTFHTEPTFFGATDGMIVAKVTGGTIFDDKTYKFEWKNSKNQVVGTTKTEYANGEYNIILENIPSDTYYLTIWDKNHTLAVDKAGCTISKSKFTLHQPQALKAEIKLIQPISCHMENEFGNERDNNLDGLRDEGQDGILKIVASGGVPFSLGTPYKYLWKKQKKDGSWQVLPFDTDIATGLSDGNYAINIEDANGVVLGEYNLTTNTLQKQKDVMYKLSQPEKLTLLFSKIDATCKGNDGSLEVFAKGGTPPYTYMWSNGKTSSKIENLSSMPYFVTITDSKGCQVEGTTTVEQPEGVKIQEKIKPLKCNNASDAQIEVFAKGGTLPYKYEWSNGATTSYINNLSSGSYKLKITDVQGCSSFKTFNIENPPKFELYLGEDRTLCSGQNLEVDKKIEDSKATYLWTLDGNFFSNDSKVKLSKAGVYKLVITNANGCIASDEIVIKNSNIAVSPEFLLTTQTYENKEVVLVNTTTIKPESSQWIIPNDKNIEVISENQDNISLIFKQKGEYKISLKQTQGDCFEIFHKTIIVEENNNFVDDISANKTFVKEFLIAPNPNDGNFQVKVSLEKASVINLRLYDLSGKFITKKQSEAKLEHLINFSLQLSSGGYILVLETPYQQLSKKILIH